MTTRLEKEDVKKLHEGANALVKTVIGEDTRYRFALFLYTDFEEPDDQTIRCGTHLIASMPIEVVQALMIDWLEKHVSKGEELT